METLKSLPHVRECSLIENVCKEKPIHKGSASTRCEAWGRRQYSDSITTGKSASPPHTRSSSIPRTVFPFLCSNTESGGKLADAAHVEFIQNSLTLPQTCVRFQWFECSKRYETSSPSKQVVGRDHGDIYGRSGMISPLPFYGSLRPSPCSTRAARPVSGNGCTPNHARRSIFWFPLLSASIILTVQASL